MSDPWFRFRNGLTLNYGGKGYHGLVNGSDQYLLVSTDPHDVSRGFVSRGQGSFSKVVHCSEVTDVREKQWWARYRGHTVKLEVTVPGSATIWLTTPRPPELGLVATTQGGFDKRIPFEELEDYWVELTPPTNEEDHHES